MPRLLLLALLPLALAVLAVLAPGARADVLVLQDGRLVDGIVVEETADGGGTTYLVLSRFGETRIPADQVKERLQGRSVDEQVRARLETLAPDDAENRALLAKWLVDLGREEEGRELAAAVLELDPESALAHEVLGHVRHHGVWCTPDEAKRAEGLEKHGDQWYTPAEWANLSGDDREQALEREKSAEAQRLQAEVNRAVRLMTSPDEQVRLRGRNRLLELAAEYENPSLAQLAENVDAYVQKLDELRAAAMASPSVVPMAGGGGAVLGEVRATVARLKRPIQTFETTLASGPFGAAPVKIQLPELEVIRVRTTAEIPVSVK